MSDTAGHESCETDQKISTFVFLDFEATGLTRPRITELCLLAVNRVDLCQNTFPRVSNKLVLCVDPKKPIDHGASLITGLYNDSLEYQKPWSEDTVSLIDHFLSHLAGPVCLVAHYGNGFDFPLLLSELQRVNKSLSESLYCADSLEGFRELDGLPRTYVKQSNGSNTPRNMAAGLDYQASVCTPPSKLAETSVPPAVKRKSADNLTVGNAKLIKPDSDSNGSSTVNVKKRLDFGETEVTDGSNSTEPEASQKEEYLFSESLEDGDYLMALDMVEKQMEADTNGDVESAVNVNNSASETESCIKDKNKCTDEVKAADETVQCAVTSGSGYMVRSDNKVPEIPNKPQEQTSACNLSAVPEGSSHDIVDRVTQKPDAGKDVPGIAVTPNAKQNATSSVASSSPATVQRKSYKLEEIYFRTFGIRPQKTHCAEADCDMLMKISTKAPKFIEWIDKNSVLLSSLQG